MLVWTFFVPLTSSIALAASPVQTFTLDGTLYSNPAMTTLLVDPSVVIDVKVLDSTKTCVLYEEAQTVDTTAQPGLFSVQVGSPYPSAKRTGSDPGNTMATVFQNSGLALATNAGCASGYTPTNYVGRVLRMTVSPSSTGQVEQFSDMVMDAVPNATVAETLQGFGPTNFLKVGTTPALTQANVENVFSSSNYSSLTSLIAGTSSSYMTQNSNGANLPSLSTSPSGATAGQIWFDSSSHSLKYYNGTSIQALGVAGTGITMITTGSGLTGGTITSTGAIGLAAGGVGTAQLASGAVVGASLDPGITIATTGNITSVVSTSSSDVTRQLELYASGSSQYVTLKANLSSSAYTLTLPASGGVAGSVLATDGSGNLSWNPSAAGSLTSLNGLTAAVQTLAIASSGTAPSWNSGGSVHALNLPYASSSGVTGGLLSYADYQSFSSKLGTALGAGQIYVGSSGGVATAVTPTGDLSLSSSGLTTLTSIRGKALDTAFPSVTGQVLRWDNTALKWSPAFLTLADVQAVGGGSVFPGVTCTASQALNWASPSDTFTCQSIQIASSQITYASTGANLIFAGPASGAASVPTFRALTAADLPTGIYDVTYFKQGGNSFGAQANIGTNDAYGLTLSTAGTGRAFITSLGSIGVGTASPSGILDLFSTGNLSALILPRAAVASRPTGVNGMLRYASDTNQLEGYVAGSWTPVATGASGASQWSNGASSSINYTAGSVGIGTSNPTRNLHVNGVTPAISLSDGGTSFWTLAGASSAYNYASFASAGDAVLRTNSGNTILTNQAGGNIHFATGSFPTNDTPKLTILSSGNVGIGTTVPASQLTVFGGANSIRTQFNSSSYGVAFSEDSSSNLHVNLGGADRIFASAGGTVGIGTLTPAAILDLYSTGTNSALILPRAAIVARPAGINGMLRYASDTNQFEGYLAGAWTSIATGLGAGTYLPLAGGTMTGAIRGYTGTAAQPAYSFADPTTGFYSTGIGNLSISTAGTQRVVVDSSGNLGVGTASPLSPLHTTGNLTVGNGVNTSANGIVQLVTGGVSPISNRLVFGSSGGWNFAIGKSDSGTITDLMTFNSSLNTVSTSLSSSTIEGVNTSSSSPNRYFDYTPGGWNLNFGPSGSPRMTLLSGGNVGIGTSNPGAILDLYSSGPSSALILPRANVANRPAGINGMLRYASDTNQLEGYVAGNWTPVATGAGGASQWTTSGANLYYNSTGNVGIGTTSPSITLDVETGSTSIAGLSVNGAATAGTTTGVSIFTNMSAANWNGLVQSGDMALIYKGSTSGTAKGFVIAPWAAGGGIRMDANGNVGIGSSTPAVKLDVAGGINASGGILSTGNLVTYASAYGNQFFLNTTNTAASPTYSFNSGSINSGMFNPAASTLGFSTAGLERLRIDASGNIGIGLTSPQAVLDLYATGLSSAMILPRSLVSARPTGVNGMLRYANDINQFEGYANGAWSPLTTGAVSPSQWTTSGSSIYYSSGSVGIGTTTPAGILDVEGGSALGGSAGSTINIASQSGGPTGNTNGGNIIFTAGTANGSGTPGNIQLNASKVFLPYAGAALTSQSVYGMYVGNVGYGGTGVGTTDIVSYYGINLVADYRAASKTQNLSIVPGGNVGIGTSSPGTLLDVTGATTSGSIAAAAQFHSGTAGVILGGNSSGGGSIQAGTLNSAGAINNTSSLALNPGGGNVGIGTITPASTLQVNGTISNSVSTFSSAFTCGTSTLDFSSSNFQRLSPSSIIASGTCTVGLTNLTAGGSYTLVVTGTAATNAVTYNFSGYTFKYLPTNGPTTAGKDSIYTFLYDGTNVYVTWSGGY